MMVHVLITVMLGAVPVKEVAARSEEVRTGFEKPGLFQATNVDVPKLDDPSGQVEPAGLAMNSDVGSGRSRSANSVVTRIAWESGAGLGAELLIGTVFWLLSSPGTFAPVAGIPGGPLVPSVGFGLGAGLGVYTAGYFGGGNGTVLGPFLGAMVGSLMATGIVYGAELADKGVGLGTALLVIFPILGGVIGYELSAGPVEHVASNRGKSMQVVPTIGPGNKFGLSVMTVF